MKFRIVVLIFFPFLLMAQTPTLMDDFRGQILPRFHQFNNINTVGMNNTRLRFAKSTLSTRSDPTLLTYLPKDETRLRSLCLKESYSDRMLPDSLDLFPKNSLLDLKSAGNNLSWSSYLQYGANLMGYLSYLGYKIETKKTYNSYSGSSSTDKYQVSVEPIGYIFSVGSTISSLASIHTAGQAGSDLITIGSSLPNGSGYKLIDAGNYLKSYRTLSYISGGLSLIATVMLSSALSNLDLDRDEDIEKISGTIYAAGGLSLAGLVIKVLAVDKVGDAGERIESFSNDLKDPKQKYYFVNCGINLKKFESKWDAGLGATIAGMAAIVISAIAPNPIAPIAGLGLIIVGHVMSNWLAPAKMGSAGSYLTDFEFHMR